MNLINAFVHSPVKVSAGVLLVALFGTVAVFRMPMQLTPEVQTPTLTIETTWPGASPQEVEREIVQEQEKQLKSVEGVRKMTSESRDSAGTITMEFAVGTDMREALLKVNTRLQQVREYPEDADEPVIRTANLADRPIAWFILSPRPPDDEQFDAFETDNPDLVEKLAPVRSAPNEGTSMFRLRALAREDSRFEKLMPSAIDVTLMRKFAEDVIEARFERVDGVSDANVLGGREEEMQVIIDPQKLAIRQLTVADVRTALRSQNKDTSAGDFWEGKRRYVVRTLGQFRSPDDVANTVIAYREGAPVYVRDIGEVKPGFKKPDGMVRRFGTQRLAVNALRETGANVLDVMKGLRQAADELNAGVLKQRGLELSQVYDETEYIYSSINLVKDNILFAGALTVGVLLLFLRSGRSTLVIGLAIPTSIVGTFLMLQILGRSLNVVSLAGLAFAVGMLVDNAVVVLENIFRHYQMGERPFHAAVRGTQEVWGAVLSSTLTTVAVFLPIVFVEEEAGQLFRDIALAITCGILLSLVVSITVIPPAAARILKDRPRAGGDGIESTNGHAAPVRKGFFARLAGWGPFALAGSLLHMVLIAPADALGDLFIRSIVGVNAFLQRSVLLRLVTVLGFVSLAGVISWLLLPKVEYLPNGNRNLIFCILLPPPGYNLDHMISIGEGLETDLRPYWDVDPGSEAAAQLDYPPIGDYFYVARGRNLFMGVKAVDEQRAAELIPLVQQAAGKVPGTFAVAKQASLFEQSLSGGRTIDIEITGPELPKLIALGGQIIGQVQGVVPNARAIPKPSLDLSSPEMHLEPKVEQMVELGLNATDLGYAVDTFVDGAYASDFFVGGDKIDLRIIGQERLATRTQDIESLPISTRSGELVQLKAVADVKLKSGPEQINHRERLRAITIEVSPPPEVALEDAMGRINEQIVKPLIESGQLEGGLYQINLAGTADKLRSTWTALWFNLLLAVIITYLLMAALFESWLYPLVVIASVPLGAVGGILALQLLNLFVLQPLDVLTMLGFVILIGTVVNNPILIVEQTLVHIRQDKMSMRDAVLESVRNRIRPIFMTTTTTVFGLLPLVLMPGSGSELYRGLGAVVLGGLVVSTLVTLVVVPSLFTLTMQTWEAVARLLGIRARDEEEDAPTPAAASVVVNRGSLESLPSAH